MERASSSYALGMLLTTTAARFASLLHLFWNISNFIELMLSMRNEFSVGGADIFAEGKSNRVMKKS